MKVEIKVLDERIRNWLPSYATVGSAAFDVRACMESPVRVEPGSSVLIPTGFCLHVKDPGYAGMLLPRSGIGHNYGIVLGNLVGLIDSDYQGQLMVSCWNRSQESYLVAPLTRIAQLVIVPVARAEFDIVDCFTESERGEGGFGSTGAT